MRPTAWAPRLVAQFWLRSRLARAAFGDTPSDPTPGQPDGSLGDRTPKQRARTRPQLWRSPVNTQSQMGWEAKRARRRLISLPSSLPDVTKRPFLRRRPSPDCLPPLPSPVQQPARPVKGRRSLHQGPGHQLEPEHELFIAPTPPTSIGLRRWSPQCRLKVQKCGKVYLFLQNIPDL